MTLGKHLRTTTLSGLLWVAAQVLIPPHLHAAQIDTSFEQSLRTILETSMRERKGVQLYVNGTQIPGLVTAIESDHVELKNQTFGKVVVRINRIDGAAIP